MGKIKINDKCEFPFDLNMFAYTEQAVKLQEGKTVETALPDSYYQYKLRGVVVHLGIADSGHYYSFIVHQD